MTRILLALIAFASTGLVRLAQADGDQVPREVALRAYRALTLLRRPATEVDLGLVPYQVEALERVEGEFYMSRSHLPDREMGEEEHARVVAKYRQKLIDLQRTAFEALLPHQQVRFFQIELQQTVRADQSTLGLTHPEMIDLLGLPDPQLETVKAKAKQAETTLTKRMDELMAEIAKAKQAARDEVLSALTPEQRKQYAELIGKPFDPSHRN